MATPSGPPAPGALSPDGLWRWDGERWVPAGNVAVPPSRGSRAWIWWLGGCAVLVAVVGVVAFGFLALTVFNVARTGGFNCVPSDFPAYPGEAFRSVNVTTNGPGRSCEIVYETRDSPSAVVDFYSNRLSGSPWRVTGSGPSEIDYANDNTGAAGSVVVVATDGGSEITIDYHQG